MVSYLLPVVGIALGAVVLNDPVTLNRIAGTVLVIAGIALVSGGTAVGRALATRSAGAPRPGDTAAEAEGR